MTEQDQQDKQMESEHLQNESNKIPLDRSLMSPYLTERMLRYGKILVNREEIKGNTIEEIEAYIEEYTRAKDAREHLAEMDAIPEEKAFDLATLAYDIEGDKEALAMAREALAIDPNCLDAKNSRPPFRHL